MRVSSYLATFLSVLLPTALAVTNDPSHNGAAAPQPPRAASPQHPVQPPIRPPSSSGPSLPSLRELGVEAPPLAEFRRYAASPFVEGHTTASQPSSPGSSRQAAPLDDKNHQDKNANNWRSAQSPEERRKKDRESKRTKRKSMTEAERAALNEKKKDYYKSAKLRAAQKKEAEQFGSNEG